jgi:flagellar assembly factor FliW
VLYSDGIGTPMFYCGRWFHDTATNGHSRDGFSGEVHGTSRLLVKGKVMLTCETKYLGTVHYDPSTVIHFPEGLPGFEDRKDYILIERQELKPLVFMQSVADSDLCFLTIPSGLVLENYKVELAEENRVLDLPRKPAIGAEVLCLLILHIQESGATVNLRAPIVINLRTLRAVQAVSPNAEYSLQHPLQGSRSGVAECAAVCSA